jgi:hypothetical protein
VSLVLPVVVSLVSYNIATFINSIQGLGETVSGATGGAGKDVGKGIADVGNGVEDGGNRVAKGTKDAGEWKS